MTTLTRLNQTEVAALIPHRDPFLLIDEILELEAGQSCKSSFEVPANMDIFRGHFPDFPILPGVLVVEHMAQTACVLMRFESTENAGDIPVLAKINNASFNGMVRPGDTLETTVSLDRNLGNFTMFSARTKLNGKRIAKCELTVSTANTTEK